MHLRHPRVANSIITAFALLTLGVARPASAEEKTIKGGVPVNLATLQPGVTYTDIPNGFARPHLMMDIIKPVSDKPVPAIVFVSGNGWRSIDRAALIPQLSPIAKAGYLVAAIDYRIIGEANFPKPLEDVKTAIRFLRANAKIYNIDPDHIAVWGNSAGGHLSAMAATTGETRDYDSDRWPGQSSAVQAAVIFYGPMDLSHRMDSNAVNGSPGMSVESAFLGFDAKDPANAEKVKKANPVAQISDKTPPMLIVHGTKDVVVPISESENLYAGLTAAKRPATFIRVEGAGHSFGQVSSNPEVMAEVLAFFDRTLKGKP
ncbi:alpha/beta fold hydrolase [Bradyrhizobium manausense]